MSVTLASLDLTTCARELIHAPGSTKPHGMMLIAGREDLRVQHVAGDIEHRLGVAAWACQPLKVLLGELIGDEIATLAMPDGMGGFMGQLQTPAGDGHALADDSTCYDVKGCKQRCRAVPLVVMGMAFGLPWPRR